MGFFQELKKHKDNFVKQQQEIGRRNQGLRQEKKKYNADVKKAVTSARREAFKTEAISSAKVKAKMDARRRYNPTPQSQGSGMSAEARNIIYGSGFGSPTPVKQQVVEKIIQQRSPSKKSKKRTKAVVEKVEMKIVDPVADLLKRLPQ